MEQSVLDTIPGIGPARRRAILKAFGSVRKLRKAAIEEVAEKVPGIGLATAEKLIRALRG